jgi:hypothetical protein
MAKKKKQRAKPKSRLTDMDEEAETKRIQDWLRMVEKPLAKKREIRRLQS